MWFSQRRRAGLHGCTFDMWCVLDCLLTSCNQGTPFLPLDDVHGRTINALVKRDWIFASHGIDGRTMYKITGRGKHAHAVYGDQHYDERRFDGMCPDCGERPKINMPGGNSYGYCEPCLLKRRYRRRTDWRKDPNAKCPICKQRKRHITPSGRVRSYCLPCRRERNKEERKRYNQHLLERIAAGEKFYCYGCHTAERHIGAGGTVSDYCLPCQREYQREYRERKQQ